MVGLFPWKSEEDLVRFELEPSGLPFEYLLNEKPEGGFYQNKVYEMTNNLFPTPSRKIEIYSDALEHVGFDPLPTYQEPLRSPMSAAFAFLEEYPLILSTGHRNYYYTHSQHRNVKALRDQAPEPEMEIGVETAKKYDLKTGDMSIIKTNRGQVKMKARVDDRIAEGVVFVPHGWPEEANANLLTDVTCRECIMGYPDQKSLLCNIGRA
jgi:anaerobic selenocysteine-containing dehydrogenase